MNSVNGSEFDVNIIPHTMEKTLCGNYRVGSHVNLEVDIIARYLDRLSSFKSKFYNPMTTYNKLNTTEELMTSDWGKWLS